MNNKAPQDYGLLITINSSASILTKNNISCVAGYSRFISLALLSFMLLTMSACSPSTNHISQNWTASEQTDLPKIFVEPFFISNSAQLPVIHADSGAILTNMLSGILYQRKLLETDKRILSLRLAGTILYYENNKLYVRGELYDENKYLVFSQLEYQFAAGGDWNQELGLIAMRLLDELMYKLSMLENQQYAFCIQFYFSNGRSYGDYRNSGTIGTHHAQEPALTSQHHESEHADHHANNERLSHLELHNDKSNTQENREIKEKSDKKGKHHSANADDRDDDADKRIDDFDQSARYNLSSAFPSFQYRYNGSSGFESQQPTPKTATPVVGLPLSPSPTTGNISNVATPSGSIGSAKSAALIPSSVSGSQAAGSVAPLPSVPSSSSSLPEHSEHNHLLHSSSLNHNETGISPAPAPVFSTPSSGSVTSSSASPSYSQPSSSPAPTPVFSRASSSSAPSPSYSAPSPTPSAPPASSSNAASDPNHAKHHESEAHH